MTGRPRKYPRTRSQRYVRCLLCDSPVTLNNLRTHVRSRHPASASVPREDLFDEIDEEGGAPAEGVPVPVVARALAVPEAPERVALPPLGLDDLDDIVLAVVGQVAEPTGTIPVEYLGAVFAWREATAVFLRTVGGER